MKYLIITCLLLLGCDREMPQNISEPTNAERIILEETALIWEESGFNMIEDGPEKYENLLIVDCIDSETFQNLCRVCPPDDVDPDCVSKYGRAYACVTSYDTGEGPLGFFYPIERFIVLAPNRSAAQRKKLLVHEAIHWLGSFSGIGPNIYHDDVRRYPYACGTNVECRNNSVETRTYLRLGI